MEKQFTFELKVTRLDGTQPRVIEWEGTTGLDACKRYAALHPDSMVHAWRTPRYEIVQGIIKIVD